jgi:tRNA modification GTPase
MGGIAIVRVSGSSAQQVVDRVFRPVRRHRSGESLPEHRRGWHATYGRVYDSSGEFIDEAIMLSMPGPASYTREDVVELSCHGGPAVVRAVLQAVLDAGARHAGPGEFTKRAFLNGRIGLGQAEAILQVINARTERARRSASAFLSGKSGRMAQESREAVAQLITIIEASLDFPEDDIPEMQLLEIGNEARRIAMDLCRAASDAHRGRVLWEGASVAIVGRPNVGKSRLLNALLREERAIVSERPGTTRDTVSEVANIRGIPIRLIDTAGMREAADPLERIGVERARGALADADIALAVIDGSIRLVQEDFDIVGSTYEDRTVVVVNKSDRPAAFADEDLGQHVGNRRILRVSALTRSGIDQLEAEIEALAMARHADVGEGIQSFGARRADCLRRAAAALDEVARAAGDGVPADMLSIDLRRAIDALGEITGETAREDIVDRIFEQFCIGK